MVFLIVFRFFLNMYSHQLVIFTRKGEHNQLLTIKSLGFKVFDCQRECLGRLYGSKINR